MNYAPKISLGEKIEQILFIFHFNIAFCVLEHSTSLRFNKFRNKYC